MLRHVSRKERLRGINREKRNPPSERPGEHPLHQKWYFHERLARTEVPHYLYLVAPRVDGEPYGVGYQKHGRGRQKNTEEHGAKLQKSHERRELLHERSPVIHV